VIHRLGAHLLFTNPPPTLAHARAPHHADLDRATGQPPAPSATPCSTSLLPPMVPVHTHLFTLCHPLKRRVRLSLPPPYSVGRCHSATLPCLDRGHRTSHRLTAWSSRSPTRAHPTTMLSYHMRSQFVLTTAPDRTPALSRINGPYQSASSCAPI
jgi:hypothetical protein